MKELYVHRKGATRAFGPGREELPKIYQKTGQPVIIGGTMGTSSYLLVGTSKGEEKAFASCCHGAGRAMSRTQASKTWNGEKVINDLQKKGIYVKCHSFEGLAEEAPDAYKPVEEVVDSIHFAELARKVCKLKPIGNIKG
jgi:tRNA-splicing ligase RtcB